MKFIITAHPQKNNAKKIKNNIEGWLVQKKQKVVSEEEPADIAIVLGGDGFMIHNVAKFSLRKIPCLGINAGNVGFLTCGNLADWKNILEKVIKKDFKIEKRLGLELRYNGKKIGPFANDIYLKHPTLMSSFNVKVDSEYIYKKLSGDGIIVSTPTGSTGYNVSAGGPIIQPGVFSLVLTPICPAHLNIRPLVINPSSEIEIEILGNRDSEPIYLVSDGKIIDKFLDKDKKIVVKKYNKKLLFIVLNKHHFYKALQDKKGLMR